MTSRRTGNIKPPSSVKRKHRLREAEHRAAMALEGTGGEYFNKEIESTEDNIRLIKELKEHNFKITKQLRNIATQKKMMIHALFSVCTEFRRRVRTHFRSSHQEGLRKAFGEGLSSSPNKPQSVLAFSTLILTSANGYTTELRNARLSHSTIARIARLQNTITAIKHEHEKLLATQRAINKDINQKLKEISKSKI